MASQGEPIHETHTAIRKDLVKIEFSIKSLNGIFLAQIILKSTITIGVELTQN